MSINKKSVKIEIVAVDGLPTDRQLTGQEIVPGKEIYIDLESSETYHVFDNDPTRTYKHSGVALLEAVMKLDAERQALLGVRIKNVN